MTEERNGTDSTGEGEGSTGDAVEQQPKTVEETEAFWRNRFSARDRAHNAETAALKAQMEAMRQAPAAPPVNETPEAARVRELEQALQKSEQARQAAALQSQYPEAASILGDSMTVLPPEKLAAIEALAEGGTVRRIDPNAAPRQRGVQTSQQKPTAEKSKDELLADLRQIAPAYQEALKEGLF